MEKPLTKAIFLKNKELANTYKKIASTYGKDFYEGDIAKNIASFIQSQGGLLKDERFSSF